MDKITVREGFTQTIADILKYCLDNNTDSISLGIELSTTIIEIDMTFRAKRKTNVESDM